jgi:release factor glutamine methyltransferase
VPAAAVSSVRDALSAATDALSAAGCDTPRLDAEVMLAAAMGVDRGALIADPSRGVEPEPFRDYVRRRAAREPVAYILGRKGFRQLELAVDRRVLIPRPETELLVEVALELEAASVLDVGTGSGAVALAVADELPGATVLATDTSSAALDVARGNAARLGLADRVMFVPGTLSARERFDLLLANLPYISEAEWGTLAPEITRYEPREALVAGPGGLEAIEALLGDLARASVRPSAVALEVGAGQAMKVGDLVRGAGFAAVETRRDLAGIERVVIGRH